MRNKQPSLNSMGKAPGMKSTFLKVLVLKHLHFGTIKSPVLPHLEVSGSLRLYTGLIRVLKKLSLTKVMVK